MTSIPNTQLDEIHGIFSDFLKERGQRQTSERFAILDALYNSGDHIDADTLFAQLKNDGISVSRATVYNTLELLLDCNLIVRHQFGKTQARYERAYAYWQHDHLLCTDCGEIFEFCDPRLQSIQETVGDIYGMDIEKHALNLYGKCRNENCQNRKEAAASTSD